MSLFALILIPFFGCLLQALLGHKAYAGKVNIGFCGITLVLAVWLMTEVAINGHISVADNWFIADQFSAYLVLLTHFVSFTTAIFSESYMKIEQERGRLNARRLRLYHSMYLLFVCTLTLALLSNNLGILWVAMEAATLSTVLLVSLYRTPAALEAAWKYFILCGVGIAQALFGTILLYFAAEQVLGAGGNALFWTELLTVKAHLEPHILITAFVFLLVGYGTKAGLVPLHNWLPDAHAEGPTPISAVLSGLLLNVAVYAIVRNKAIIDSPLANHLLMGFGLVTVLVAVCFLFRQKDIKRLFAYSSIEHMGLITFAFGLGTPLACVAGVIHMTMHSLTKSAIFFAAGHASQKAGSQLISQIRGLLSINPILGWGLLLGSLAIVGLPPFGLFTSEWLILLSTLQQAPYALPLLLLALLLAFAAILYKVQNMTLGESNLPKLTHRPAAFPIYSHLIIVLAFGISLPAVFMTWYQQMSSWMVY